MKIKSIDDVVERQLCTGCGACAYLEPNRFRMVNSLEFGNRPIAKKNACRESFEGLEACPGASLDRERLQGNRDSAFVAELFREWGPILSVWEGSAADVNIRFAGSSGGAASALALYCLEALGMEGVLHAAANDEMPFLNKTVLSKSREELLTRTGSRYAPASPAEGLNLVDDSEGQFVFIGKPCDAAAVQNIRISRSRLNEKLGLVISFFCAGVPSTNGTIELLRAQGIGDPAKVTSLRYRGNGWPGNWVAEYRDESSRNHSASLNYDDSWGFLEKYRQWRCYICPDHTGEFSDIAVGDPWYRQIEPGESGSSLLVARTQLGYKIITAAHEAGYINLDRKDHSLLPRSQPNLLKTRSALWGRLITLRLMNAAVPRYSGFGLLNSWLKHSSALEKFRSISGTIKRILKRKLRSKAVVREWIP